MLPRKRPHDNIDQTQSKRQKTPNNSDPAAIEEPRVTALIVRLKEKNNSVSYHEIFHILKDLTTQFKKTDLSEQMQRLLMEAANLAFERLPAFIGLEGSENPEEEGEINEVNSLPWLLYNIGSLMSHGIILNDSILKNIPTLLTQLKNHPSATLHQKSVGLHGISMMIVNSCIEVTLKTALIEDFFKMGFTREIDKTCVLRAAGNMSFCLEENFSTGLLENFIKKHLGNNSFEDKHTHCLIIEGIGKFAEKMDTPFDADILNRLLSDLEKTSSNFQNIEPKPFMVMARGLYLLFKANKIKGNLETNHLENFLAAFRGHYKNIIYIVELIRQYDPELNLLRNIDLAVLSRKMENSISNVNLSPMDAVQLIHALVLFKNNASQFNALFTSAFNAINVPFHEFSSDIQQQLKNDLAALTIYSNWGKQLNAYINTPSQKVRISENKFDIYAKPILLARIAHGKRTYPSVNWNIGILSCAERGTAGKEAWDIFQNYMQRVNAGQLALYSNLLVTLQLSEDHYVGLNIRMNQGKISLITFYNSLHHEAQDEVLMNEIKENFLKTGLLPDDGRIVYESRSLQQGEKKDCFTLVAENYYCGIRGQWWPHGTSILEIENKQRLCLMPNVVPRFWDSSTQRTIVSSGPRPRM